METTDTRAWAELVLRRYARLTNRLIAGRTFAVTGAGAHAEALSAALQAIGARVVDPAAEPVDTVFDADPANLDAALSASYLPDPRETAAARIAWARRHMPVVAALGRRLAASGLLTGRRVGICLVLEPKTAVLAHVLAEAGATVSLYAHPEETDEEVAAALRAGGLAVFGGSSAARSALAEQDLFLAQRLHLLIDDGSRLIRRLIDTPDAARELIGAAEETTSGLRPLRERGDLPFPVIAVNDARTKVCFDNAHGTGQSCLLTILDLLDPEGVGWLHGRTVAVAGFGPVGEGFCRHARALGAEVVVADPDPVAELRARFTGYRTDALEQLVADADLVVSASGYPHTISLAVLQATRPGAVVAVAGGVEDEVDWRLAVEAGATFEPVAPWVEDLVLPSGASFRLLDRGGCINCTAGEGNPIEIMDLSFAVQLAALELLLSQHLSPGLHPVPASADEQIARLALDHPGEH